MCIIHQTMQHIGFFPCVSWASSFRGDVRRKSYHHLWENTSRVAILQDLVKYHFLLLLLLEGLYQQCFHNYQSTIFVPMAIRPSVLINIQI